MAMTDPFTRHPLRSRPTSDGQRLPPALPGFEHINRYWDPMHRTAAAKLLPGEYYVTRHNELLVTVLGSCVSACIRDPFAGVGGMNHFMLPMRVSTGSSRWDIEVIDDSTRYGSFAMERLIDEILKHGGARERLEVKLIGGGRILANMPDIGARNIEFALRYVQAEGLRLVASDLGDVYPRKLYFYPAAGRVRVLKLRTLHNNTILEREQSYRQELERRSPRAGWDFFERGQLTSEVDHAEKDQGSDR